MHMLSWFKLILLVNFRLTISLEIKLHCLTVKSQILVTVFEELHLMCLMGLAGSFDSGSIKPGDVGAQVHTRMWHEALSDSGKCPVRKLSCEDSVFDR
jgi:hypothetical protein